MAGNKRQRELERVRRERQEQRRREARRKRRRQQAAIGGVVLAVAAVIAVVAVIASGGKSHKKTPLAAAATPKPSASASPTASPTPGVTASTTPACGGKVPPAPKKLAFAKEPPLTIDTTATYVMHLATSCGEIDVTLDAAKAPRTVNALAFLASQHYFDGTYCHRETAAAAGFAVLQCGDPTGTGGGVPGTFTLPEENLTGTKYVRGEVAMAKTSSPHSTGSQFFLLDSDAAVLEQPKPTYTLVGKISKGLDVLDRIEKLGQDNSGGSGDGKPLRRVYFTTVTVTKV